jgi:four helix bundle protein
MADEAGFKGLRVWRDAHAAVLSVYEMTRKLPTAERFGLTNQMRRAAVSIGANVAEGAGRRRALDKARLYTIAQGSLEELKYYLILAKDLGYLPEPRDLWNALESLGRQLYRLIESMEARTGGS